MPAANISRPGSARAIATQTPFVARDRSDASGMRDAYDEALAANPDIVVYRITGALFFGATGPFVMAIYSNIFPDNRHHFIATHSAAMIIQHVLKVIAFGLLGFAFAPWAGLIVAMVATGFAGTWTGTRLLNRIPEASFRVIFKALISLVALHLLWRGLASYLPA